MSVLYGLKGRIVSALALFVIAVSAAQATGVFELIPPQYNWIAGVLIVISGFVASFSERVQGGASQAKVRAAAEKSAARQRAQADALRRKLK